MRFCNQPPLELFLRFKGFFIPPLLLVSTSVPVPLGHFVISQGGPLFEVELEWEGTMPFPSAISLVHIHWPPTSFSSTQPEVDVPFTFESLKA